MKLFTINKIGIFIYLSIATLNLSWAADHRGKTSITELLSKLEPLYWQACEIRDCASQAREFDKIVQLIDYNMNEIKQTNNNEIIHTCLKLKGLSLRQQAAAINNQAIMSQGKAPQIAVVKLLRKAVQLSHQSCEAYKSINDLENFKISQTNLAEILQPLSMTCAMLVDIENNPSQKLILLSEAVKSMEESYAITPTKAKEKEFRSILAISLPGVVFIYDHLSLNLLALSTANNTMAEYKAFLDSADLTNRLIQFTTDHLINSKIEFKWYVEPITDSKPAKNNRKKKTTKESPSISAHSHILDPHEFIALPWTVYCAYQKHAASTITLLSSDCSEAIKETYSQRAQEHLHKATDAYHQNVYNGEYKEQPTKEKLFILARLEDLIGNEKPLKEFYQQLHVERKEREHQKLVQYIRTQQIENNKLDEQKEIDQAEKLEKASTTQKINQKEPIEPKEEETLDDFNYLPIPSPTEHTKVVQNH